MLFCHKFLQIKVWVLKYKHNLPRHLSQSFHLGSKTTMGLDRERTIYCNIYFVESYLCYCSIKYLFLSLCNFWRNIDLKSNVAVDKKGKFWIDLLPKIKKNLFKHIYVTDELVLGLLIYDFVRGFLFLFTLSPSFPYTLLVN